MANPVIRPRVDSCSSLVTPLSLSLLLGHPQINHCRQALSQVLFFVEVRLRQNLITHTTLGCQEGEDSEMAGVSIVGDRAGMCQSHPMRLCPSTTGTHTPTHYLCLSHMPGVWLWFVSSWFHGSSGVLETAPFFHVYVVLTSLLLLTLFPFPPQVFLFHSHHTIYFYLLR